MFRQVDFEWDLPYRQVVAKVSVEPCIYSFCESRFALEGILYECYMYISSSNGRLSVEITTYKMLKIAGHIAFLHGILI